MREGAANRLPPHELRRLFTNNSLGSLTAPGNQLHVGNAPAFQLSDFGLKGVTGEPGLHQLIDWARGADIKDIDNDPNTTNRKQMGDSLHSQPAAVVYGNTVGGYESVIYTATNDGYLHALDGVSPARRSGRSFRRSCCRTSPISISMRTSTSRTTASTATSYRSSTTATKTALSTGTPVNLSTSSSACAAAATMFTW